MIAVGMVHLFFGPVAVFYAHCSGRHKRNVYIYGYYVFFLFFVIFLIGPEAIIYYFFYILFMMFPFLLSLTLSLFGVRREAN